MTHMGYGSYTYARAVCTLWANGFILIVLFSNVSICNTILIYYKTTLTEEAAFKRLKAVKATKAAEKKAAAAEARAIKKAEKDAAKASVKSCKKGGATKKSVGGGGAGGPAGVALNIGYKVTWNVKGGDPERSRNTFKCLHYCRARALYKAKFPDAYGRDLQETCRVAHDAAGAVWDAKMSAWVHNTTTFGRRPLRGSNSH